MSGEEPASFLLHGDKDVFQSMGHRDGGIEADDPRGPFQRVRRAHHRLDGRGAGGGNPFETEEPSGDDLELRLGLSAEQIEK